MAYNTKLFKYYNTLSPPSVIKEYLISIGVEETSLRYYDKQKNGKNDIPIAPRCWGANSHNNTRFP